MKHRGPGHRGQRHGGRFDLGCYVRAHLRRRLFVWFGASIVLTALSVGAVMIAMGASSPSSSIERMRTFIGGRFAALWNEPSQRDELAKAMARDLEIGVVVRDEQHARLVAVGDTCDRGRMDVPVVRDGATVGTVEICAPRRHRNFALRLLIAALTACAVIWAVAGKVAKRLSQPLDELVRVAQDIGRGRFDTRVRVEQGEGGGEVGRLGSVINEMAARIEKQLGDQRELLAAVSHEIRTPLTRIRILVEMARDTGRVNPKTIEEIDREVVEIDALVSELLASSRLQFAAVTRTTLDAEEVARRALERAGFSAEQLAVDPGERSFEGDPTLVARALANLIDNAKRHGGGLTRLKVDLEDEVVRFVAEDDGPGFSPGSEREVFDPFVQKPNGKGDGVSRDGLGLGLSLVRRIAEAHGGKVDAKNRDEGGAAVSMELPRI